MSSARSQRCARRVAHLLPEVALRWQRADVSHSTIRDHFVLLAKNQRRAQPVSAGAVSSEHEKQIEVLRLIQAYRVRGHQAAQLDPLGLQQRTAPADLAINNYGLTDADLDTVFRTGDLAMVNGQATLREIVNALRNLLPHHRRGIHAHRRFRAAQLVRPALGKRVRGRPVSPEIKSHLLERLTAAEGLESTWVPSIRVPSVSAWKVARA